MNMKRVRAAALAAGGVLALTGCGGGDAWSPIGAAEQPEWQGKIDRAAGARDAVAAQLMKALQAAVAEGGPQAGIEVCSQVAQGLTREVGELRGVEIGRTSHRLRNPDNAPPDWAAAEVKRAGRSTLPAEPEFYAHSDGRLAALFPIMLQPQCVACHGPEEELAEEVKPTLAQFYPQDRATGFQPGDLRGWFWVEVP